MTIKSTVGRLLAFLSIAVATLLASPAAEGEEVGIKTNLFYDATATINIGAEARVAHHWSIDLSGNFNGWTMGKDRRWKHWMVQPEARYWFCEAIGGHFLAAHLLGGQYNFGGLNMPFSFLGTNYRELKDHRFQGWYGGIGVGYGYTWLLNRHWNLELEAGIGWVWTSYDKYPCASCGRKEKSGHRSYVGPTKAAVNIVYVF